MIEENPYKSPSPAGRPATIARSGIPVSATLFGVLNMVFGVMGEVFVVVGLIAMALISAGIVPQPALPAVLDTPALKTLNLIGTFLNAVMSAVLIGAGVGLLRLRPWGRRLSNWWAAAALLQYSITLAVQVRVLVIPAVRSMDSMDLNDPNEAALFFGAIGGVLGGCFSFLYPTILLIFMNRRSFREQIG